MYMYVSECGVFVWLDPRLSSEEEGGRGLTPSRVRSDLLTCEV